MKIRDLILDRLEVSVSKFCKEINITRPTIDNILLEKNRHNPSLLTIKKICKYFNVDWRDFVE